MELAKGFLSLGRAYSIFTLFTLNWTFSMRCSSSSLVCSLGKEGGWWWFERHSGGDEAWEFGVEAIELCILCKHMFCDWVGIAGGQCDRQNRG